MARVDWVSGVTSTSTVERVMPLCGNRRAGGDRYDNVREVCEGIWATIADNVGRGYVCDGLYKMVRSKLSVNLSRALTPS